MVLSYDLLKNRHIDDITIINMTNLPTYHMVCTEMGLKMNVFSADVILNPLTNWNQKYVNLVLKLHVHGYQYFKTCTLFIPNVLLQQM